MLLHYQSRLCCRGRPIAVYLASSCNPKPSSPNSMLLRYQRPLGHRGSPIVGYPATIELKSQQLVLMLQALFASRLSMLLRYQRPLGFMGQPYSGVSCYKLYLKSQQSFFDDFALPKTAWQWEQP